MEKPFGTDLETAGELNDIVHEVFDEDQIFRIDHFLGKEAAPEHPRAAVRQRPLRADLEPQPHRPRADRGPRGARARAASLVLRADRRLPRHGRHAPLPGARVRGHGAADGADAARDQPRRRTRSSARCCRSTRATSSAGSTRAIAREPGVAPDSRDRDVRRAALRGRQLALVGRAVLPAHRKAHGRGRADHLDRLPGAAAEHVPGRVRGRRRTGPDHLTFDLDEASRLSLSFYGKRPGPGMVLEKLSMQFSIAESGRGRRRARGLRAADPRRDAGDATLFTTAEGIERLWEVVDPAARASAAGASRTSRAPGARTEVDDVIAPHRWRLPFERPWREAKITAPVAS